MKPLRVSQGLGRYVAGETDIVLGTRHSWTGGRPPLIYCHGAADTAETAYQWPSQRTMVRRLAQHFTVAVCDLGGDTFGNDPGLTRIGQAKTYLSTSWGAEGPAVIVGGSMGALNALVYTRANPADVLALALFIPALDIADIIAATVVPGTIPAMIHAAYGGAYDDEVHGPTRSPVQFADQIDPDLPVHMWTASDDLAARPGPVAAFLATRPETGHTDIGALGHTQAAIAASTDGIVEFATQYAA